VRGRKRKPTARAIAEGDPSKRGVHKLDQRLQAEPAATKGLPFCPRHLNGAARKMWRFWREELEAMDLDRRPDVAMLEGACVAYARAVDADAILHRDGLVVTEYGINEEGQEFPLRIKKHPAVEISRGAWILVRSFCSEFGLSPVARTRLAIGKEGAGDDDFMQLLRQPRGEKKPEPTTVQ
jgi:P27 family predicted phage terminase small subunit